MLSVLRTRCVHTGTLQSRRFTSHLKHKPTLIDEIKNVILGPEPESVVLPPIILSSELLPSRQTKVTTLKNSIRVATQQSYGDMATIAVCVDAGSRYECERTNGVSHFLEQLAFKNGSNSKIELAIKRGAEFNSCSSREHTFYTATVFKDDVPLAVEILSSVVQNTKFSPESVNTQRGVVLNEIANEESNLQNFLTGKLHELAFRGTSLARPVFGTTESVSKLTADDLSNFVKSHHTGDRIVVVGAGAVEHEQLCKLASGSLSDVPSTGSGVSDGGKPFFIGSDIRMREDDLKYVDLAIGFEGLSSRNADVPVLSVMSALLATPGNNPKHSGSKLIKAFASEDLVENVKTFNFAYNDTGLFGVYIKTKYGPHIPDAVWMLQEEVTSLCYEVDDAEVLRAVNQVKSARLGRIHKTENLASEIGENLLSLGRYVTEKEMFDRLDTIRADDVKRVAMSLLNDRDLVLSVIGPLHTVPDYARFRRRTYWLRY